MNVLRLWVAVVVCALVVAGCSTESPQSEPSATTETVLPPPSFADLTPIFDPPLASLGVRLTRGALVSTVTRRPSPTGRHLALYVEPTDSWTASRYADNVVPLTRMLATDVFGRWSGLESFDVCQEPPPGVDDRPEPPTVSTVELTRDASADMDWSRVDLTGLLAASRERGRGVHIVASEALRAEPAYQAALAAAERSNQGD
ncbi:MAG: hypothetical protein M3179_00100 [Actinomycetota bacterium]|nr:hypothetical protein [Actinomycetota bacterium]